MPMKTKNQKISLYVKQTLVKVDDQKFVSKTSYFVNVNGILKPVYMRKNVKNVGYVVPLNLEDFNTFFTFEVPKYSEASNDSSEQ